MYILSTTHDATLILNDTDTLEKGDVALLRCSVFVRLQQCICYVLLLA